jgi:hypothetical protein
VGQAVEGAQGGAPPACVPGGAAGLLELVEPVGEPSREIPP